jgi:hypothetical protein
MSIEQSYIKKYGTKAGPIIFRLKQKEAAHAKWKAQYSKKLKECQAQLKRLGGSC